MKEDPQRQASTPEQAAHWLSSLALFMVGAKQPTLYLNLDLGDLITSKERWLGRSILFLGVCVVWMFQGARWEWCCCCYVW